MPYVTVNLTPPLTGAQGTICFISGETVYPLLDLPPSDYGAISFFIAVSAPELDYAVIFPEQTVDGVTYLETSSELFNLITNVMLNVTLTPKAVTPPPVPVNIGVLVAVAVAGVLLLGKK